MSLRERRSRRASPLPLAAALVLLLLSGGVLPGSLPSAGAFAPPPPPRPSSSSLGRSLASLSAMNRRNKFNKQKDLAAKMAEAKRLRELAEAGVDPDDAAADGAGGGSKGEELSAAEIKLRNDRKRFEDLLDGSLSGGGGDYDRGHYLTEAQEDENADAVFRGVVRLYEGDPAPTPPFEGLVDIGNGEAIGKGGAKRLVPWEGSRSATSGDYLVVITDPRPKSAALRTAVKGLAGTLSDDVLRKCLVLNVDTPAENRRFVKRNLPTDDAGRPSSGPRILCDEKKEWMREYTALGEKRFSMTVFVLRGGRVEKIAREVEAEVLPMAVKNAIRSLD